MKKLVLVFISIALIGLFLLGDKLVSSGPEQVPQPKFIEVESLLKRYGKQEEIVLTIQNKTEDDILFPDNQYGMNLFKRQSDGMWSQIPSPELPQSQIYVIKSGEKVELTLNPGSLSEGKYQIVFEGWHRGEFGKLLKGDASFSVVANPTFEISLSNRALKTTEGFDIIVTNDRASSIIFDDNTLSLKLFIKNETEDWMELPSPLYRDDVPFELSPGQKYSISMPPLKASGDYRIVLSGKDESGLELSAEIDLNIIR